MSTVSFNINELKALTRQAGPTVAHAIEKASTATGVNFAYLMQKAAVESSFNPDAKAKTSSATGLFQFLDKTWMGMVKKYGDKYGMGKLAAKIDDNGHCPDPVARRKILALRKDPEKAACMAAEYDSENCRYLKDHTTGPVGATELYFAHFMGAGGATRFLNHMHADPSQNAAKLFPEAASANRAVFYDKAGKPRSLAQVYDVFAAKFQDVGDKSPVTQTAAAPAPVTNAPTDVAADAIQTILGENPESANAMIALLKPAPTTRHPRTITQGAGIITWNGPRMQVAPDTVRLMMLAKLTAYPGNNNANNGHMRLNA